MFKLFYFNDVAMYTYSMNRTVQKKKKRTRHGIVRKAIHSRAFLQLTYSYVRTYCMSHRSVLERTSNSNTTPSRCGRTLGRPTKPNPSGGDFKLSRLKRTIGAPGSCPVCRMHYIHKSTTEYTDHTQMIRPFPEQ
jgi:hypothetical protein